MNNTKLMRIKKGWESFYYGYPRTGPGKHCCPQPVTPFTDGALVDATDSVDTTLYTGEESIVVYEHGHLAFRWIPVRFLEEVE